MGIRQSTHGKIKYRQAPHRLELNYVCCVGGGVFFILYLKWAVQLSSARTLAASKQGRVGNAAGETGPDQEGSLMLG